MRLNNPAPGRPVTSAYGWRIHPITKKRTFHRGTDFGGTFDVIAAGDGIVHHIGWSRNGGGHVVIIKHATTVYSVYYHGRERTTFNKGDRIRQGQEVYPSGTTGASTGPHLHFELRKSMRWGNTVDPMAYIDREVSVTPKPGPLKVDGRMGKNTWAVWQEALKRDWGYEGIIDGRPGKLTYIAIQRSVGAVTDGIIGPQTRMRVQKRLKDSGFYLGPLDGVWGKGTYTALQRALNQNNY